ncbi:unnamed protein product [Dibothriocephalus latus]|uniref:Glycoside hydrolase family 31 TIM barrel domain-containing protein n=1 Tax=Dibothriocephalus latus TaxID=60516 RepID=A0A3P7P5L1_DIBLA|nr:unnamed protein product [Dibothriocephalus latus]
MANNHYWQIAFKVLAQRSFGPGERRTQFLLRLQTRERAVMWALDTPPKEHTNLYGVHKFFLGLAADGTAFGIFLLNFNDQEVEFQPMPALTYRTIGGILDFIIFLGPHTQDVDIDYIDGKRDWTVDPVRFAGLGDFIRETIHGQNDMRAVIIFDAAIQASLESNYEVYWDGLRKGV